VARQAVWLSGKVTYREVAEILQEIGQAPIAKSTVWRLSQHWGEQIQTQAEQNQAQANATPGRQEWIRGEVKSLECIGVTMDSAMVLSLARAGRN
jgi:hypothetical protein